MGAKRPGRLVNHSPLSNAKVKKEWVCTSVPHFLYAIFRDNFAFVVYFLLGNSPASEVYMPTFRNTLFHLHRQVGVKNFFIPT